MSIVAQIANDIRSASTHNNKSVMFHYSVLLHANELRGIDPVEFCEEVGVPESYKTEFRKMIKLAEFMKQMGMKVTPR
jgi:hypothetical protein